MTPDQWAAIIAQTGVGGLTVFALYRVLIVVGERFIKALDRVSEKIDQHTKDDLSSHADVSERLARIEKAMESDLLWRERTPVETPPKERQATNREGEPLGRYHLKKKGDG